MKSHIYREEEEEEEKKTTNASNLLCVFLWLCDKEEKERREG